MVVHSNNNTFLMNNNIHKHRIGYSKSDIISFPQIEACKVSEVHLPTLLRRAFRAFFWWTGRTIPRIIRKISSLLMMAWMTPINWWSSDRSSTREESSSNNEWSGTFPVIKLGFTNPVELRDTDCLIITHVNNTVRKLFEVSTIDI